MGDVDFAPWLTSPAPAGACRGSLDPMTVDDCKKGGWRGYGFRNQGQCIRFVNTGKDDRIGE